MNLITTNNGNKYTLEYIIKHNFSAFKTMVYFLNQLTDFEISNQEIEEILNCNINKDTSSELIRSTMNTIYIKSLEFTKTTMDDHVVFEQYFTKICNACIEITLKSINLIIGLETGKNYVEFEEE